ncbi:MAG: hypothetical protein AAFR93_01040 [Pseudomonadota bacterium]
MHAHPDFADSALPKQAHLAGFTLTPLSSPYAQEDFDVVMASAPVLKGLFGNSWPEGLTLEANRVDLAWHEREFDARRSFAWIIRGEDGGYQGCAYLYPELGQRGVGEIAIWFAEAPGAKDAITRFKAAWVAWLRPYLPQGYVLKTVTNAARL